MAIEGFGEFFWAEWRGTLGATEEEIFTYHRVIASSGGPDGANVTDTIGNDVTNLLAESTTGSTPFSNIGQIFPTTVAWTWVKVSTFHPDTGEIEPEGDIIELTDAGLGASSQGLPYQDSLAITFCHRPPTRTSRNRFYLPPFVWGATDGHGRVLPTLVDDIQTQLDLDQTAHLAEDDPWQYCVWSPTLGDVFTLDRWMTGDVMDTIRRRRNKLPEVRHILDR